ncbi:MAG: archease [Candidatus Bipolaricaulota bacterium]|nr:archease [Candidatus Bipolaricaulota bacterium]MCS7275293.1 archease [Candidatus Bipolaricaulota bacterium]MDW8111527.1 archease [Candidatus Bipolaricaulota bacterium]MDW8329415.1 archease [Candidatus Bipolaricaulota bacterium]
MGYEYFEVTAEVGIRAWGKTLEESFVEAARALFELMVDTSKVHPQRAVSVALCAESLEVLLADWLNRLILERDRTGCVFSEFRVTIALQAQGATLTGEAWGEPLDRARHDPRIDVKAATYHHLRVLQQPDGVQVECVLDI